MIHFFEKGAIANALYATLQMRLGRNHVGQAAVPIGVRAGDLAVIALDGCQLGRLEHWESVCKIWKMDRFYVQVHGGEVVIGPIIREGQSGCLHCWAGRYFSGRETARQFSEIASVCFSDLTRDPWITPLTAEIVASIAAERICAVTESGHGNGTGKSVYYWDLRTLTGQEWPLLLDPSCSKCCKPSLDSAERAHLNLTSRPKSGIEEDRLRNLEDLRHVADIYVGRRANILSDTGISWPLNRGAVVTVAVPLSKGGKPEPCSGFCDSYDHARTVAVLEGLERYASLRPRAYQPAVHASICSLPELAVNPRLFGLHSEREYIANPKLLTPYSDQLEMDFVWAYSFANQKPALIPQQIGFYSHGISKGPLFVIEGSIGCAVGSCPEECILHGMFEVLERDAFLLTWYARLARPKLDPMDCDDPEVRYHCRQLQLDGFEMTALDITTEFGIPTVLLVARRNDEGLPHAVCIAASHLNPRKATKKAFRELSGVVCRYTIEMKDRATRTRASVLAENPSKIRSMMDHALFYCLPESGRHLDFLTASGSTTSLDEMSCRARPLCSNDLQQDLQRVVQQLRNAGSDVLVVDQTAPEQSLAGLYTYKALITGAIPMTWGEHLRRLEGLPRLDAAIGVNGFHKNSHRSAPNPVPHPYP